MGDDHEPSPRRPLPRHLRPFDPVKFLYRTIALIILLKYGVFMIDTGLCWYEFIVRHEKLGYCTDPNNGVGKRFDSTHDDAMAAALGLLGGVAAGAGAAVSLGLQRKPRDEDEKGPPPPFGP
jgi:hypothetical protein